MITIVFDDSNLQAEAVMYLDNAEVEVEGAQVWRIWSQGNSIFSKLIGKGTQIMCTPVHSIDKKSGGHFETIAGLNELEILTHALKASGGNLKNSETFKGSTFGGHFAGTYSFFAMLIKQGTKDRFGETDVHSGVKFGWGKSSLIGYINKVRSN